jgi:hypothetical protein
LNRKIRYLEVMDAKQIEKEALALPESLRAGLVCRLLQTLPPSDFEVSDEEALQRDRDLDTGAIEPLSHEEFVRRVEAVRGR